MNAESRRLEENRAPEAVWHRWGPYVSDRQWGTVREDYSPDGNAWEYLPHDHARSRAYRWGEDGIAGICDRHGHLHLALALWNGRDPILKERFFGLTNAQGNHGEDVKEVWWHLDGTPTHSYMKMRYRYPQAAFPYEELLRRNREASRNEPEVEITDLDVFHENRFFDVDVEWAKETPTRLLGRITVTNHGPDAETLHVLPTVWFRNVWSWKEGSERPSLKGEPEGVHVRHLRYGSLWLAFEGEHELLFTENDTNDERLFDAPNPTPYVKDAFHRRIVDGDEAAVNPKHEGTKVAAWYSIRLDPGESRVIRFALLDREEPFPAEFDERVDERHAESDAFYASLAPNVPDESAEVQRRAFAGLLWSKQFYHYDVETWLQGDPAQPAPPPGRTRNENWSHVHTAEVLSMPDKWEYPWFAAWDLAFHTIPLALIDPKFAKQQLILLLREWYQHPNGEIPAYEWNFSDVNPPVHAWAAWRVYNIERRQTGRADVTFLKRIFHKLLLNFTWWVNRQDTMGNNAFEGGFLGLDNVGVFDRNHPLPDGSFAEQSDGTAWMGFFCLNMLEIALEIAREDRAYEDVASKFFEHFLYIASAMNHPREKGADMWNEEDGFYYDVLRHPDGTARQIRLRSIVGLVPLFAVMTIEPTDLERFPGFRRRTEWFIRNRPDLTDSITITDVPGKGPRLLLSIVDATRLRRVLGRTLDPKEFLSDHGVRSMSQAHRDHPYTLDLDGMEYKVGYEPGESQTSAFGGNSNWRGPVWMPMNYLLIESLQKFGYHYGDDFKVTSPGSGEERTLAEVAADLERRLLSLFLRDPSGRRPANGSREFLDRDPLWRDELHFYEYFHGDTGEGLGASHQTGWTALMAKIIEQLYVTNPNP